MSLTEAALKKMNKDEVILLAHDYQDKFSVTFGQFEHRYCRNEKRSSKIMESDLSISRSVNCRLCDSDRFGKAVLG